MAEVNTVKVISDSSDYETAKAQIETAIQAQENLKVLADLQRLPEEASSETREYCRKIIREADSQIERLKNKYSKIEEKEETAKKDQVEVKKQLDKIAEEKDKRKNVDSNNFNDLLTEHEKMRKEIVLLRHDQELQAKKLEKAVFKVVLLIAIVVIISIAINGFTHQLLKY